MDSAGLRTGMELRRPYRALLRIVGAILAIPATGILLAPLRHWSRHNGHDSHRTMWPFALTGLVLLAVSITLLAVWWLLAGRDAVRDGALPETPYD